MAKEKCAICGEKIKALGKVKTKDGVICGACGTICPSPAETAIADVKKAWSVNHQRSSKFSKTREIKDLMTETITIDDTNQLFYIGKEKQYTHSEPIIYAFSEVTAYEIAKSESKTITKKKGGITRAVVGGTLAGPAGAIVGAATATQQTKEVGGHEFLKVTLNTSVGRRTLVLTNIYKAPDFFEGCLAANQNTGSTSNSQLSSAEQLRQYKALLDDGIITIDEFNKKKRQLLGL